MAEPADELIPTRATLIQRLKDWQDQASWQDFFDTYWKLIYSFARKFGLTGTEAQDVVQETMVCVAKRIPHFKYDPRLGSFKSWLLQLTHWRITDQLRLRGPLQAYPAGTASPDAAPFAFKEQADSIREDEEQLWETEWAKNLVDAAIARVKRRLEPEKYQIFDLYVNKEWPAAKVAATFHIPVQQVYLAKHRVTELIKAEVKRLDEGVT